MRVPSNITNCVCFLGFKAKGGEHANKFISIGTGFFVGVDNYENSGWDFLYLVTARHVVDEAKRLNVMPLYARVNTHNQGVQLIALNNEWASWQTSAIDVAVMATPIPPHIFKFEALPMRMLATDDKVEQHGIGLGDELFAVGLFTSHTGKQRNIPIMRTGVIAAMPEEPFTGRGGGTYHAYLAEMRSIGGLSGSPVFVYLDRFRCVDPSLPQGKDWTYFLIGLIRGHWDLKREIGNDVIASEPEEDVSKGESLNTGIAVITPAQYIVGILQSAEFEEQRKKALMEHEEKSAPTLDVASIEPAITAEVGFTRDSFQDALKKVSQKISSPDEEMTE